MNTNITANVIVQVGEVTSEKTLVSFTVHSNQAQTQQVKQKINATTGVNPDSNQVWIYSEGSSNEAVKEKLEGLGFFGSPNTYSAGNGAWACIDLNGLRETGMPIPPVDQLPFADTNLAGESFIQFKLSSGSNFDNAVTLQQSEDFPAITQFLTNLKLAITLHGQASTINSGLELAEQVGISQLAQLRMLTGALSDINLSLKFASWRDLSPDSQALLKSDKIKKLFNSEVASMVAMLSDLFEHDFKLLFVVNDSVHIEIEVRAPGLTNFAMFLMDGGN